MRKILVACDFSSPALKAYRTAEALAAETSAEVLVLKVIDLPFLYETTFGVHPVFPSPLLAQQLSEQAKTNYEKMKELHHHKSVKESFLIERGAVAITILNVASDKNCDLVIMGSSGAGGMGGIFVGSNVNKVIRSCKVPVICVRKSIAMADIKDIVFPVYPDMRQKELVSRVKELQELTHAKLHLLLVNTPGQFLVGNEAESVLAEYTKQNILTNFTVNIRNYHHEYEGIVRFAKEIDADLIAIGTHGREGLSHLIRGSITEDVLRYADCAVWTFLMENRKREPETASSETVEFPA